MSDRDVENYEILKTNLLKRFRLTEGGYMKRFKQSRLEPGETPNQFVNRLRRYLHKWRTMAGFDSDVEGLENLILRDQFFITCDKPLQTFLKEKGKLSLDQMANTAEDYIETHASDKPSNTSTSNVFNLKHKTQDKKYTNCDKTQYRDTNYTNTSCTHCGLNNYESDNCRKKNWNKPTRPISCFRCGKTGHKSYDCRVSKRGQTQQAAAMQVLEPSIFTIQQTKHNVCNENHKWTEYSGPKEGEVQLACGCMLPIVAGALNPDGQHSTPNCIGSVNAIQVSTLRDTASTTCVIISSLVHPEQYTGLYDRCVLIDGVVKCFPTAIIKVDTPFFKGVTKA